MLRCDPRVMRANRIAIVTESFLPTVNGVTNSVVRVLEHIRDTGREAIVITPASGAPTSFHGMPVFEVPSIAYRQFPLGLPSPQVGALLQRFAPDVLHAASPFFLGGAAIASAKRLGIPSVAVFQTDVAGFARRNQLAATTPLAWQIIKTIHNQAELTVAPSSASIADLKRAGVKRVGHWVRGVDLDQFHPDHRQRAGAKALRARIAPNGELVVGYVGRIAPEKGLERFRELKGVKNVRLVLVGDGPAMPAVQRSLSPLNPAFLGELRGANLADAYGAFDVFVHTGIAETFGQTLQEAAATGLPVVAPRAGGPIDLVDDGETGFLYDPVARGALKAAVEPLLAAPSLRAQMGEAGRRRVLGRTWPAVCAQLDEHWNSAIGHGITPAALDVLMAPRG